MAKDPMYLFIATGLSAPFDGWSATAPKPCENQRE
jgi:hypothetical protein